MRTIKAMDSDLSFVAMVKLPNPVLMAVSAAYAAIHYARYDSVVHESPGSMPLKEEQDANRSGHELDVVPQDPAGGDVRR